MENIDYSQTPTQNDEPEILIDSSWKKDKELRVLRSPSKNAFPLIWNAATLVDLSDYHTCRLIFTFAKKEIEVKGKKVPVLTYDSFYRDGIVKLLNSFGFCKIYRSNSQCLFVRIDNGIVAEFSASQIKDYFIQFLDQIDSNIVTTDDRKATCSLKPEFIWERAKRESHLFFNDTFLAHLSTIDTSLFVKHSAREAIYQFTNCRVSVTPDGIRTIKEWNTEKLFWESQIIQRKYTDSSIECQFRDFCWNLSGKSEERFNTLRSQLGYLLHNYKGANQVKIILFYDEEKTTPGKPEGGTGKTLLIVAIGKFANTVIVDGQKADPTDKFFFQNIDESTQVFVIDDASKDFNIDLLNSASTTGFHVEGKKQKAFMIPHDLAPKMAITSNVILASEGNTRVRRQSIFEVNPFYKKLQEKGVDDPVKYVHGNLFFSEWDSDEWNSFQSFMMDCVYYYLTNGLQNYTLINVQQNRAFHSIGTEFMTWIEGIQLTDGTYNTGELYNSFHHQHGDVYEKRGFSNRLKKWAEIKGFEYCFDSSHGETFITLKSNNNNKNLDSVGN
ncbi:hypothetical protein QNI19_26695 [Cytophagaceae bacterium DM2B3-1]|uniref:Uncharacterized protein n=1 Tax=Xanthocytophaga flava TaxID=3048013 RepID=A0ABT7CUC2_9BACT|nr:hypothetical protein [Xanthocytophaga flavus]MDJ1496550.1 hypothetical protein [Xanthocytophaga flavus]